MSKLDPEERVMVGRDLAYRISAYDRNLGHATSDAYDSYTVPRWAWLLMLLESGHGGKEEDKIVCDWTSVWRHALGDQEFRAGIVFAMALVNEDIPDTYGYRPVYLAGAAYVRAFLGLPR